MTTRRSFLNTGALGALGAVLAPRMLMAQTTPPATASVAASSAGAVGGPRMTLNNGVTMPALGFGTYRITEGAAEAVEAALRQGYRGVDTGAFYGNEEQVGRGIARSGVAREDVFVATKLWMTDYGYDQALAGFDTSLRKLGLDYVDLYLLHYPSPSTFEATLASYRAAERLMSEGRVKAIGVSNFLPAHLDRLVAETDVVPAVNQVEVHPYFIQRETRVANARHGVVTQAWSPIGGIFINHPKDPQNVVRLLDDPRIVEIAERNGRTPAQVVLRWHLQNRVAVIPKSVRPERMASNADVFGFDLAQADMIALDDLDRDLRGGTDPEIFDVEFLRRRSEGSRT